MVTHYPNPLGAHPCPRILILCSSVERWCACFHLIDYLKSANLWAVLIPQSRGFALFKKVNFGFLDLTHSVNDWWLSSQPWACQASLCQTTQFALPSVQSSLKSLPFYSMPHSLCILRSVRQTAACSNSYPWVYSQLEWPAPHSSAV